MLCQELLDLLFQPVLERVCQDRKVQRLWGIVRQIKEPRLDTPVGIFQAEIQNFALRHGKIPERLPLRNAQAQPQCQPRFSDLRRAREDVQALWNQLVYQKRYWRVWRALQLLGGHGFEFLHLFTSFRFYLL